MILQDKEILKREDPFLIDLGRYLMKKSNWAKVYVILFSITFGCFLNPFSSIIRDIVLIIAQFVGLIRLFVLIGNFNVIRIDIDSLRNYDTLKLLSFLNHLIGGMTNLSQKRH
jgi:hypothetical protein